MSQDLNYDLQLEMEKLFHKNQLPKRIRAEFEPLEPQVQTICDQQQLDFDFIMDLMVQLAIHKRANLETLIGILRRHFDGNCQTTADKLTIAAALGFCEYDPADKRFIVIYNVSDAVQEEIDRYQYPLPMVCKPQQLKNNRSSGYFTEKGKSLILKDNHHDGDICIEHLDRLNSIPLKLNHEANRMVKAKWQSLEKKKDDETLKEFNDRRKAFAKYRRTVDDVHEHIAIAGGTFYLTHRYDKRGRIYCAGYQCTYQGMDYNKAAINFANEEVVSDSFV